MTDLRDLLEELRRGERPPLSVDEIEMLLGWLTGSAARDGAEPAGLPNPGHDAVLLQMVLYRLDDVLFDGGGELRPAAAGLDTSEPATRRRIRFRRLASAFHPDRFPELADWLTRRSQAVHRAYAQFKQDPDGPIATPSPVQSQAPRHAGRPRQDIRRAPPRVRKHRFRAFANQLRSRFGNDRYLAHKLIGGLALLALLPVLNMVLVPGSDSVDGSRFAVDAGKSAPEPPPTTEARFAAESGQDPVRTEPEQDPVGAGSGRDDRGRDSQSLAGQAPTPVAGSEAGEDPQIDSGPATGVEAGLAGDERSTESRISTAQGETTDPDAPARKPQTGNREPSPTATDPEITPLLVAARHAMNPNGDIARVAVLPTVDEQLAAMGLSNDTERLYRRIGEAESVHVERVTVDAGDAEATQADVDSAEDVRAPADHKASLARQAPTSVAASRAASESPTSVAGSGAGEDPATDSVPATGVGAGLAGDDGNPESRIASVPTETAATGRPARKPETRNPKPSAQSDSDLTLGPLASHPAGEVLKRLHAALDAGNIPGIAGSFAPDAQMDSLSGRDEIAAHFRATLDPADSRRVRLKVVRLGRASDGWRIETDMDVRVEHDGHTRTLVKNRNIFWLAERGERLLITRLEHQ